MAALTAARAVEDRPSLIVARTHIGYGSPKKQDTFQAHGEPLGADEVRATKRALGWPEDPPFHIPDDALQSLRLSGGRGATIEASWQRGMDAYAARHADEAEPPSRRALAGELPAAGSPICRRSRLPTATWPRATPAARCSNALAAVVSRTWSAVRPTSIPSTRTAMKGRGDFESPERAARPRAVRRHRGALAASGATRGATFISACASTRWPRR